MRKVWKCYAPTKRVVPVALMPHAEVVGLWTAMAAGADADAVISGSCQMRGNGILTADSDPDADADDRQPHTKRVVWDVPTFIMSRISAPPNKRRKRSTALVEDDLEAAEAVTHEKVTRITRSGATKIKNVLVPLVPVVEQDKNATRVPIHPHGSIDFGSYFEDANHNNNCPPRASKVRDDYYFDYLKYTLGVILGTARLC
jgi:hypothetical protein